MDHSLSALEFLRSSWRAFQRAAAAFRRQSGARPRRPEVRRCTLKLAPLYCLGILSLLGGLAAGQSSHAAAYDTERRVRLQGPVTRIDWVNPHAFFFIQVGDVNWAVEFGEPLVLERQGWNRNSLHVGDIVSIEGNPARGQKKQAYASSVTRAGQRLFAARAETPARTTEPAPRWPDGKPRLGPAPGKKGYWGSASVSALVENVGTPIAMNRDGLLENLADIDRVAPLQPWAKAIYEFR